MTLSNVFIGKKVVQQIYLNNAIIYQSKGWETLPCAPTEVWTKSYDTVYGINDLAVDLDNNVFLLSSSSDLHKFNPDGLLIWKKRFDGAQKVCIDQKNNIYVAQVTQYSNDDSSSYLVLSQLDSEGNITSRIKNKFISDTLTGLTFDDNYLYLSGHYESKYNCELYKVDKGLKTSVDTGTDGAIKNLITTNTSPYMYWSAGSVLFQVAKNNLSRAISIKTNSSPITNIVMDNLGNVIYSTNTDTYRYNISDGSFTKIISISSSFGPTMCIDYHQDLYGFNVTDHTYAVNLLKISSDNTQIYNTQILIGDSYVGYGKLITDNNGNIYFFYRNSQAQLFITKMINLIKKG